MSQDQSTPQAPQGLLCVPLEAEAAGAVRLFIAVRRELDAIDGCLVLIRDNIDAQVYLGGLMDRGGRVLRWLELWVQSVDHIVEAPRSRGETITNLSLDERWGRQYDAMRACDAGVIETGWERSHPLPLVIDLDAMAVRTPVESTSGHAWRLCTDDAALEARGLPKFSASHDRFLYVPELAADSPFAVVTAHTAPCEGVLGLIDVLGPTQAPLNVGGGLMLARAYSALGLQTFGDLLSGKGWEEAWQGQSVLRMPAPPGMLLRAGETLDGDAPSSGLLLGRRGRAGRLVESFFLKLMLLESCLRAVRDTVQRTQLPLLNLRPESFQVEFGSSGGALPSLWTARARLVDPGHALEVRLPSADASYFVPGHAQGATIFLPESGGVAQEGVGVVQVREAVQGEAGMSLSLTFSTMGRFQVARSDLVWLRLSVQGKPLALYARLSAEGPTTSREWRLRTLEQPISPETLAALKTPAGMMGLRNTPFQVIPVYSTPLDLYSMAVIAMQVLLVSASGSLQERVADVQSLVREAGERRVAEEASGGAGGAATLERRLAAIFAGDESWSRMLGPQRLVDEPMEPAEAFDLIPPGLWWQTLALLARMHPGHGPDSYCADLGSAPPRALHRVFDPALAELGRLLDTAKSLIVIDWKSNREINAVIRAITATLSTPPAGAAGSGAASATERRPGSAR